MNREGKIRRALNAYGGYRTHKTTEFDTHVNALPPMPLHPPDDTGEFEAERIRPARAPNIEADGCVPGLWAFVFATCAGVFWLWGWLFFEWPWFYVIPIFVTVFTIAFYLSIGAIQKTLWTIERIFHVDLDQDGAVGPPTTAMEINIRNEKGTLEKQFRGRFSIGDDRLRTFARGALIGKALTLSTWAGSGKLFTRPEFEGFITELEAMGIVERINPDVQNSSRKLTETGREILAQIVG